MNKNISSDMATIHSAEEYNGNYIPTSEMTLNIFRNQLRLLSNDSNGTVKQKVFANTFTTIYYTELSCDDIKHIIKQHLWERIYNFNVKYRFQDVYKDLV